MEISDVRAHALSSPIDPVQERPFHGGVRLLRKRDFVLVVLEAADGEVGYAPAGASASAMREYYDDASQAAFARLFEEEVGPTLVNEPLDGVADAHDRIDGLELPAVLASQAAGAADVALHDLIGKRHGAPVYELLADGVTDAGGDARRRDAGDPGPCDRSREAEDGTDTGRDPTTTLDLYASAGMYMEPSGYAEQAATLRDCGFVGYKYRPGIGPAGDRETFRRLLAVARGDGEAMAVMADAHTWWKLEESYGEGTTRDLVAEWADDACWVEEPVAPDDYAGYADLAETGAALAGGESEEHADGLVELAETGAVSFLQGDVRHHGGYTGCLQAVEHCRGTDVEYVPHHFGTLLGLVANAHLVAGAVDGRLLEYPVFEDDPHLDVGEDPDPGMYPFELAFDVLETDLYVADGRLEVPDGPGLGVEVDEGVVEEYPFVEGPWTEFRYGGN